MYQYCEYSQIDSNHSRNRLQFQVNEEYYSENSQIHLHFYCVDAHGKLLTVDPIF